MIQLHDSASPLIMNARMYSVKPRVEAIWQQLLERVTAEAGVPLEYVPYPAPQPLEVLWARPDLGCVFMCGYPVALQLAQVVPLAAPVPRAAWAAGRPLYRSDLIVRTDAPYRTLEDTFGGRAGWTIEHSHSGFNAFRHHLQAHRTASRPKLYGSMIGNLVTARAVLDAVREGRIDVGPLDAYWHMLIARHDPTLTAGIRVLDVTDTATLPAFVTSASTPVTTITALRDAFANAACRSWFKPMADELLIDGFARVDASDYARTLEWDRSAKAAGYPYPA
jgi:ABC-type phosphate/phosphonate transport system substrate-binding protein